MSLSARTSASHPIQVDFLDTPGPGRLGITFAPGKKQPLAATGAWDRDLKADLARLRTDYQADYLVCLLEDAELAELLIPGIAALAADAGLHFHRFPMVDGDVPSDSEILIPLVSDITGWL